MMKVSIVPISSLEPAAYNPRDSDPARLDMIELSLRRLGFLFPVYANGGRILSGHQRHLVADRMGLESIPVCQVPDVRNIDQERNLNVLFNRGTNEMRRTDFGKSLLSDLTMEDLEGLTKDLPEIDPGNESAFFRCAVAEQVPIKKLLEANVKTPANRYGQSIARALYTHGVMMPVLAREDGTIINGIGRLHEGARRGMSALSVVYLREEEVEAADVLVNRISMDFDMKEKYSDLIRYGAFRHNMLRRGRSTFTPLLGDGFRFEMPKNGRGFDIRKPGNIDKWRRIYGNSIVDFGAGHLTETRVLRSLGIHVAAMEPYYLPPGCNRPVPDESRQVVREFLADIAEGTRYDSIFLSSVLNSVPFEEDRIRVMRICHALAYENTRLRISALSRREGENLKTKGKEYGSLRKSTSIAFQADFEPNTNITSFSKWEPPKVQHYYGEHELRDQLTPNWEKVSVKAGSSTIRAKCEGPKPINVDELREALEFEYDLPYADGTRMGLVEEAKAAFSKRLDMSL